MLIVSLFGLALLNMFLVAYVFFQEKPRTCHESPRETVMQRLHFSQDQRDLYRILIKKHKSKINFYDEKIKATKKQLYVLLKYREQNTFLRDSLIGNINHWHAEIERTHYTHFLDLKKICTAKQMLDYEAVCDDLADIFSKHRRRKGRILH